MDRFHYTLAAETPDLFSLLTNYFGRFAQKSFSSHPEWYSKNAFRFHLCYQRMNSLTTNIKNERSLFSIFVIAHPEYYFTDHPHVDACTKRYSARRQLL